MGLVRLSSFVFVLRCYMKFGLILWLVLVSTACFSSGCYSTYLEGTRPGYGRVPLYSSGLLAASSLLLKTEASRDDKDKQTAANTGLIVSGLYSYFALHGYCKTVDRKKYDELWNQRITLLKSGMKEENLPFQLRWLVPIGTKDDFTNEIQKWKRYQKALLFIVGGLNSGLLFENAQNADTEGVKYFSYLSIAAILGMAIFDVDNLWNEKGPSWANVDIYVTRIENQVAPVASWNYRF